MRRSPRFILIPARSGSKGLRHKNIQRLGSKPLLQHAVDRALRVASTRHGDKVVVSTDSKHYARIARRAGALAPFLRPAELATDATPLTAVVRHGMKWFECQHDQQDFTLVVLSPTTPFVRISELRGALKWLEQENIQSVVSVVSHHISPSWIFTLKQGKIHGEERRVEQRDKSNTQIRIHPGFLLCRAEHFRRHGQFAIPAQTRGYVISGHSEVDIESRVDLDYARWLYSRKNTKIFPNRLKSS